MVSNHSGIDITAEIQLLRSELGHALLFVAQSKVDDGKPDLTCLRV